MTPPRDADNAVVFAGVTAVFNSNVILDDVSASAPLGRCTTIVGPNGAGKTTFLAAMLGGVAIRGAVRFPGFPAAPRIGYVPQRMDFDAGLPLTLLEFVCLGWQRLPLWLGVRARHRRRGLELLEQVGLAGAENRKLGVLSGGEMRRALLALALGREPELLVLDEPTSGVDAKGERDLFLLLEKVRRERGFTQIMVCHNLSFARHYADHVICLNRRVVAEGSPDAVMTPEILAATFIGQSDAALLDFSICRCDPAPERDHA